MHFTFWIIDCKCIKFFIALMHIVWRLSNFILNSYLVQVIYHSSFKFIYSTISVSTKNVKERSEIWIFANLRTLIWKPASHTWFTGLAFFPPFCFKNYKIVMHIHCSYCVMSVFFFSVLFSATYSLDGLLIYFFIRRNGGSYNNRSHCCNDCVGQELRRFSPLILRTFRLWVIFFLFIFYFWNVKKRIETWPKKMKRKKKPLTISADKIRKLGKAVRIFVTAEEGVLGRRWFMSREFFGGKTLEKLN